MRRKRGKNRSIHFIPKVLLTFYFSNFKPSLLHPMATHLCQEPIPMTTKEDGLSIFTPEPLETVGPFWCGHFLQWIPSFDGSNIQLKSEWGKKTSSMSYGFFPTGSVHFIEYLLTFLWQPACQKGRLSINKFINFLPRLWTGRIDRSSQSFFIDRFLKTVWRIVLFLFF